MITNWSFATYAITIIFFLLSVYIEGNFAERPPLFFQEDLGPGIYTVTHTWKVRSTALYNHSLACGH